jgi:hypothetical protein
MPAKIFAVIAVVLGLLLTACGGDTAAPPPVTSASGGGALPTSAAVGQAAAPVVAKIGERVELNGTALTVAQVARAARLGQDNEAKQGNEFVVAEVVIENTGADKLAYNPSSFKVKNAGGLDQAASQIAGDTSLKSGELAKGERAQGIVAFEVKQGTKGLVLEYKPGEAGSTEVIKVALE